jgi:hypothetical protein
VKERVTVTAFQRLQSSFADPTVVITRRQLAAFIGLAGWMAATIDVSVRDHFEVLRVFSSNAQAAAASGWDIPATISSSALEHLGRFAGPLLRNTPVQPLSFAVADLFNPQEYDGIIIVDASGSGLGALVLIVATGELFEVSKGWDRAFKHSAWAEPLAARLLIQLTRSWGLRRLAVVTDHEAMPRSQRRPWSGNGGFSLAFYLNDVFRTAYLDGDSCQFFTVPGDRNPSDRLSRSRSVGDSAWRISPAVDKSFPPLSSFFHPYASPVQRPWWNV